MSSFDDYCTARVEEQQSALIECLKDSISALKSDILEELEKVRLKTLYRCSEPNHPDHYKATSVLLERKFDSLLEMRIVYNQVSHQLMRDHCVTLKHYRQTSEDGKLLLLIRADINYDRISIY